jgi:hypothetical protein
MGTAASGDETGATAGGGACVRVAGVEVTEGAPLAAVDLAACDELAVSFSCLPGSCCS